jgi:hypothetical protein
MRHHALALAALSFAAFGQPGLAAAPDVYVPRSGQPGKDVVWVPSPQALVDRMLDMAKVTKADYLVDLGSGDGRTVITAAQRGVRAHGIEYNPDLVALSRRNALAASTGRLATFAQGDIFESDFSRATVVTLFLLPALNLRLRPILLGMKPGTRVVSNSFDMGQWRPDETIDAGGDCTSFCRAHLWIVPAKVEGVWRLGDGALALTQDFQSVSGTLTQGGAVLPLSAARLEGAAISFTAGGQRFSGTVTEARMSGSRQDGTRWTAVRQTPRAAD